MPVKAVTYPMMGEVSSTNGEAKIYSLPGTTGHEAKPEDKNKSKHLCTLKNGTQVKILGIETDGDGDKWYKINFGENFSQTGYGMTTRIAIKYDYEFDEDFEKNLQNFPESYHEALRKLHAKYPNWKFVANKIDMTFKEAVEAQYGVANVKDTRKWVEFSYDGGAVEWRDSRAFNSSTNQWIALEGRWTYASRTAIEYFMDPRNSLDENKIFAFMQQSHQEDEKLKENLQSIIKGTFLEKGYDKNGDGTVETDAYIEDLIAAANESKVSAYVLAATIIVEQGTKGESGLISGKQQGYEGYYNFFNFNASGSSVADIVKSGLEHAKKSGWNSRTASIIGGAKMYADGYISIGQDTYYYKDFNVVGKVWNHQYASALYDAWVNASYLRKGCVANNDAILTFSIPVFEDMPTKASPLPTGQVDEPELPSTPDNPTNPSTPSNPSTSSTPSTSSNPSTSSTPSEPKPVVKKGDINNDGKINAIDLASVNMDILKVKKLSGDSAKSADINDDGKINAIDLASVNMDILKVKPIS